ncbi:MAG: hypothetical protein DWQ31_12300, partial [Planctomycetota bacterium]
MSARLVAFALVVFLLADSAAAQTSSRARGSVRWRPPGEKSTARATDSTDSRSATRADDDKSSGRASVLVTADDAGSQVVPAAAEDPIAPRDGVRTAQATGGPTARPPIARVTKGSGTLPNDQGQVWREYDISPYTLRVTSTNQPEQAIVDWILRETGYEAWHGEEVAVLNATRGTLRVYHTPEKQAIVGEIVDRFVNTEAETQAMTK